MVRAERKLRWWGAEKRIFLGLAGIVCAIWLFGLADIVFKFSTVGRWICFSALAVAACVFLFWTVRGLLSRLSAEAIAARIERTFPELDNHLINSIQFSNLPEDGGTGWQKEYLKEGVKDWAKVDLGRMREKREFRRAFASLAGVCLLVVVSAMLIGAPWQNAMARIINPLSQRPASVFATIFEVLPGNMELRRGDPVTLEVVASGLSGQEVSLELWPEDDERSRIQLGSLTGDDLESFAYTLDSVASGFHYRFRAGDAISSRFEATVQAPLSVERIHLQVYPPAYTGIPPRQAEISDQTLRLPEGSRIEWTLNFSRPVEQGRIVDQSGHSQALAANRSNQWKTTFPLGAETTSLQIEAETAAGENLAQLIDVQLERDQAPTIEILFPPAKVQLDPTSDPSIRWQVSDDHGVARVRLERIDPADPSPADADGELVQEWALDGRKQVEKVVSPPAPRFRPGESFAYRLVAWDNCDLPRGPQKTVSAPILFEWKTMDEATDNQSERRERTGATLERLVEMQRGNLTETRRLQSRLPSAAANPWDSLGEVQEGIRSMARVLIDDPQRPLGPLTIPARQLYENSMLKAVERLHGVPLATESRRADLAERAVRHQDRILRILSATTEMIEKVEQNRQITELLSMIDRIIDRQQMVHKETTGRVETQADIPDALVDLQDRLGEEMSLFIAAARREAETVRINDAAFADLLIKIAGLSVERELPAEMFRAAEQLEEKRAAQAIPHQENVLVSLHEFHRWLSQWRMEKAREHERIVAEAMSEAVDKLERITSVQANIVEGMRAIAQQEDMGQADFQAFAQELQELSENVREASLQVAADLHIFPEFTAINELVEDIFTIFEEVDQEPGSEFLEIEEFLAPKNESILAALEEALELAKQGELERADNEQLWLGDVPDNKKVLSEAFDEEEIPEIANAPLPSEFQDFIGDLLEQQEELNEQAQSSSTNQATADIEDMLSEKTVEGNFANFSAQGQTGNEIPDHNEQTGRSLVGRQGMASGETAAGSGMISEGDENILERRTDDPAMAGQVEIFNQDEVNAVATGGGKDSGISDRHGMSDDVRRSDVPGAEGSEAGMQAMLRRSTEQLYARANSMHIKTGVIDEAIMEMRRAEEAIINGRSMQQVAEHQRRAAAALRRTQADLSGTTSALPPQERRVMADDSRFAGAMEEAPSAYRDLVAEYYRALANDD